MGMVGGELAKGVVDVGEVVVVHERRRGGGGVWGRGGRWWIGWRVGSVAVGWRGQLKSFLPYYPNGTHTRTPRRRRRRRRICHVLQLSTRGEK